MFPETKLYIYGVNPDKLQDFTFADATFTVEHIPEDVKIDHAFECVGGAGSGKAINQVWLYCPGKEQYQFLEYQSILYLLIPKMGAKRLRIFGSSRSGVADFEKTVALYKSNPEIINYLSNIVGAVVPVRTIEDMKKAFEMDIQKAFRKTIMMWDK